MNKKAELAMILLPAVTIVLCLAVLFAFITFDKNIDFKSGELAQVYSQIRFNEDYVYAQAKIITSEAVQLCQNCSSLELKEKISQISASKEQKFRYEGAGNLYAKIRNNEYTLSEANSTWIIKIDNVFVEAKKGNNEIKREFNITLQIAKSIL